MSETEPRADALRECPMCGTAAHFFKVQDETSREWGGEGICCQTNGCAQVGLMWSLKDDCRPQLAEIWNRRAALSAQVREQQPVSELRNLVIRAQAIFLQAVPRSEAVNSEDYNPVSAWIADAAKALKGA